MKEVKSSSFKVISLPVSVSAEKAKSLMGRSNLKQYIMQLTTAKGVCGDRSGDMEENITTR